MLWRPTEYMYDYFMTWNSLKMMKVSFQKYIVKLKPNLSFQKSKVCFVLSNKWLIICMMKTSKQSGDNTQSVHPDRSFNLNVQFSIHHKWIFHLFKTAKQERLKLIVMQIFYLGSEWKHCWRVNLLPCHYVSTTSNLFLFVVFVTSIQWHGIV